MADTEHPSDEHAARPDGAALARGWLENSPFVAKLGIRLEEMEPDRARLAMPFSDSLPTTGDVVHGGAISSLIDTAAAAAAWFGAPVPEQPRASTVGLTVDFLAPARAQGVTAEAQGSRYWRLCGGYRHKNANSSVPGATSARSSPCAPPPRRRSGSAPSPAWTAAP